MAYTYDSIGNISSANGDSTVNGTYQYTAGKPHAVATAAGNEYFYDAAGNMTVRPGQTLAYDVQNRLVRVTDPSTGEPVMETLYDASGNRVLRQLATDAAVTTTVYMGSYETDLEAGVERVTHSANGSMVGVTIDGELRLTATDHLGSSNVSVGTDGTGEIVQRYTPFGAVRSGTNEFAFDQTFTGQTDDPGTGLIDYNARHYDPLLGRFIMADPILDGLNRYTYVRNNPLKYTDPTGNCTVISGDLICGSNSKNYGPGGKGVVRPTKHSIESSSSIGRRAHKTTKAKTPVLQSAQQAPTTKQDSWWRRAAGQVVLTAGEVSGATGKIELLSGEEIDCARFFDSTCDSTELNREVMPWVAYSSGWVANACPVVYCSATAASVELMADTSAVAAECSRPGPIDQKACQGNLDSFEYDLYTSPAALAPRPLSGPLTILTAPGDAVPPPVSSYLATPGCSFWSTAWDGLSTGDVTCR